MPRPFLVFFLLSFCVTSFGQSGSGAKRLAGLFLDSDYEQLTLDLDEIRKRDPAFFAKNDYDYLYARASEKLGNFAKAAAHYEAVAARDSDLKYFALKRLSALMRESGNLALERIFLNEIRFSDQSVLNQKAALERLVRNYFESGDDKRVIEYIEKGAFDTAKDQKPNDSRELHVILGNAYLRSNEKQKAQDVFLEIIEKAEDTGRHDDFSLDAARGLDRLEDLDSKVETVANLTAAEHEQRAGIYQHNRDFKNAGRHFKAIVDNHAGNKAIPGAMYQIGRGLVQERKYEEAAKWFERVLNEYPKNKLQPAALYGAAGTYANLDQTAKAVNAYQKFIDENPNASNIERGYLNIIDAYRDASGNALALEWCRKTQNAFRGQKGEAAALFAEVRIRMSAGEWDLALAGLERLRKLENLGGMSIVGGTNKQEVEFLIGLANEKLGHVAAMTGSYSALQKQNGSYYGWRASERTKTLLKKSNPSKYVEKDSAASDSKKAGESEYKFERVQVELAPLQGRFKSWKLASEKSGILRFKTKEFSDLPKPARILLGFGLYDEAAPEIENRLVESRGKPGEELSGFGDDTGFTLAKYYSQGGYAERAIRFIEPKWKKLRASNDVSDIWIESLRLLYPTPYKDKLVLFGEKENVDPRFVLSIMRQESRFQPDIKSVAAARGLMQFISNTSIPMAAELNIKRFRQQELYRPQTAIWFGSRYIANIFKQFPEKPQAVAASYNGGEDRMERWLKRAKSEDPDQYVPEVLFPQTKDYVYKVMNNYRVYKLLYDKNLMPLDR